MPPNTPISLLSSAFSAYLPSGTTSPVMSMTSNTVISDPTSIVATPSSVETGDRPYANHANALEGTSGLFLLLVFFICLLVIGTGMIFYNIHLRFPGRNIRKRGQEKNMKMKTSASELKDLVLPTLVHQHSRSRSVLNGSESANGIGEKYEGGTTQTEEQQPEKKSFFYSGFFGLPLGALFKRSGSRSLRVTSGPPTTHTPTMEGVPEIIVSTCSPALRPLNINVLPRQSNSIDTLRVPDGRFTAPRPSPPKPTTPSTRIICNTFGPPFELTIPPPVRSNTTNQVQMTGLGLICEGMGCVADHEDGGIGHGNGKRMLNMGAVGKENAVPMAPNSSRRRGGKASSGRIPRRPLITL